MTQQRHTQRAYAKRIYARWDTPLANQNITNYLAQHNLGIDGACVVKAKDIAEKYNIHAFPTLIIVDQAGVIRDLDDGYTPTLRADVGKKIDELLANSK